VDSYEPTGTGESPLAGIEEWVNCTCPVCGKPAKRETNTMPQWAGSSWYYLRYADNHNQDELISKERMKEMLPVDMYIGGVEHAVLHLLYSRFYTKFLYDIGVVDFEEPFKKLFNQGMITGKNGIKMSKSKGNVVSPDALVQDYGCDSLRMYELFVGPPELDAEWDDRGIDGVNRFLKRVWNLLQDSIEANVAPTKEMVKLRHKMIYDITTRLESFSLNTVISGFMEYNNRFLEIAKKEGGIDRETLETIAVLLAPFAPHFAEEMWEQLGHDTTVFAATWPVYDAAKMVDDEVEVAVQINGKTRAVITIAKELAKDEAIALGKEAVADKLTGTIVKEIYVPGRIINIVQK
jgi:leucyl-tRNA synthetase